MHIGTNEILYVNVGKPKNFYEPVQYKCTYMNYL